MQRKLGMKRSFNFEDLSSIINSPMPAPVEDAEDESSYSGKRSKRLRVVSYDSSLGSACCCCEGRNDAFPSKVLPSFSSDDSLGQATPHSVARLNIPATTHHTVVTPELTSSAPPSSDASSSAPSFPLLPARDASCPATAALDRFMLKQKISSSDSDQCDGALYPLCDDDESSYCCSSWPKFDHEDLASPRQMDRFPSQTRMVSWQSSSTLMSDSSSCCYSMQVSSNQGRPKANETDCSINGVHTSLSVLSMPTSFKNGPSKNISQRPIPTVNQITEALAMVL